MSFVWRPTKVGDIEAVMALSDEAHPGLPESRHTHIQRLRIFAEGCLVLADGAGPACGYAFAHPIHPDQPPRLDLAPAALDGSESHLYLHDFVVSPALRRGGYARAGITRLLTLGSRYEAVSLISVNGTASFWAQFGFQPRPFADQEKLASYGADALFMSRWGRQR